MISVYVYDEILNSDWGSDYVAMNIYIYRNVSLIRKCKVIYIHDEDLNDIYMYIMKGVNWTEMWIYFVRYEAYDMIDLWNVMNCKLWVEIVMWNMWLRCEYLLWDDWNEYIWMWFVKCETVMRM